MTAFIFALAFAASGYSLWRASRSVCDQREANALLGILPAAIAVLFYLGLTQIAMVVAFGILFMAGIAIVGETGWRRLIPAYLVGFAIWVMVSGSTG